ncbi:hypothetical protein GY45DRAFT_1413961, partial [Cubamyces sp. BRFM 1775]
MLHPSQRDEYERINIDLDDSSDDSSSSSSSSPSSESLDSCAGQGSQPQEEYPYANHAGASDATSTTGASASSTIDWRKEVHNLQETNRKLQERLEHSQTVINTLLEEQKARKKRKRSKKSGSAAVQEPPSEQEEQVATTTDSGIDAIKEHIRQCVRRFTYVHRAWPLPNGAWQYTERPQVNPLDYNERYPTDPDKEAAALDKACAAELWDYALSRTNLDWYLDMANQHESSGKGLAKSHLLDLSKRMTEQQRDHQRGTDA